MTYFINSEHETALSRYCQNGFITNIESDVTLITRNNRSVSTHKMVLSSVSNFVKTLCTEYETIMLPDVECEVVTAFLSLLYTGQAKFNGPRQLLEFVDLTNMLGVSLPDDVREQIFIHDVCSAADSDCKPEIETNPDQATTCVVDGQPLEPQWSDLQISQTELLYGESTVDNSMHTEANTLQVVSPESRHESQPESLWFPATDYAKEEEEITFLVENVEDPLNVDSSCLEEGSLETEVNSLEAVSMPQRPELRPESPWFPAADVANEDEVKVSVENGEDQINVDTSSSAGAESSEQQIQCCGNLVDQNKSFTPAQDLEHEIDQHQCCISSKDGISLGDDQRMQHTESPLLYPQFQERLSHNNHLPGILYQCSSFTEKSTNSSSSQRHMQLQSGEQGFQCPRCDKTFTQKTHLNTHLKMHRNNHPYYCFQCNKRFSLKVNLVKHLMRHRGERPYKCSQCDKSYKDKGKLDIHFRVHSGERPYKCSDCDSSFSQKSSLKTHLRVHTGERPYKCSQCVKSFTVKGSLNAHLRVHTGEHPYKCAQCDKRFKLKGNLNSHLRVHSGERPYKCSACDKSFCQKDTLNTHFRVHSGERPYKCSLCVKSFRVKGGLKAHLRVHSGEHPYKCSQCDKSFSQKAQMRIHFRVHSGERPHKCSQCVKSYTVKSALDAHLRVHSGERPYKCSECDKSFSHKTTLNAHFSVHSGGRPYKCSLCDKLLTTNYDLNTHFRVHSGERP